MSRYVMISRRDQNEEDVCKLLPMDKFNDRVKKVDVPTGLLVNIPKDMSVGLLTRLAKTPIGRSKNGHVTLSGKETELKFDDVMRDIYYRRFSDEFEEFYCILRKYGITF